jgi:hypothetical protein
MILLGTHKGNKPFGRPELGWENKFEIDIKV